MGDVIQFKPPPSEQREDSILLCKSYIKDNYLWPADMQDEEIDIIAEVIWPNAIPDVIDAMNEIIQNLEALQEEFGNEQE